MADDDMDELDINLDELNWPPGTAGSGGAGNTGSAGWPAGGINIPVSGSSGSAGVGSVGGSAVAGKAGIGSTMLALILSQVKSDVRYVIVPEDGPCLELEEQKIITPREMIGISKFINVVNCMIASDFALGVNWSELIKKLGITKHFITGKQDVAQYDDDTDILYLFLFDD